MISTTLLTPNPESINWDTMKSKDDLVVMLTLVPKEYRYAYLIGYLKASNEIVEKNLGGYFQHWVRTCQMQMALEEVEANEKAEREENEKIRQAQRG